MSLKRLPQHRALPRENYWIPHQLGLAASVKLARLAMRLDGGLIIRGYEHLQAMRGHRVILVSNHISDVDPGYMAVSAYPFWCWYMAKEELFRIPLLAGFCRMVRGFPVVRGAVDRIAIRFAEERLERDEALLIFPEGRVNWNPDCMHPFQEGLAMFALHTNSPVIPVSICGTNRVWPYGKFFPRWTKLPVRVTFGAPLTFDHLTGPRRTKMRTILTEVRAAIERMQSEQRAMEQGE